MISMHISVRCRNRSNKNKVLPIKRQPMIYFENCRLRREII